MYSKRLIIFEGCDGTGKTTAAKRMANELGARYVHLDAYKGVTDGLSRLFVDAMMPAVLGLSDVVMDRCWLSEPIYGKVYRGGANRVPSWQAKMLERLALRCRAVVILCQPPLENVLQSFRSRRDEELLDNEEQVKAVFEGYSPKTFDTALPLLYYDYELMSFDALLADACDEASLPHLTSVASAGDISADTVLVGESFADHKNGDPLYQWPFASFSEASCSAWLTQQLEQAGVSERDLYWVNADQPLDSVLLKHHRVIALGDEASERLAGLSHEKVPHPQYWKRFRDLFEYPLLGMLKEKVT